MGRRILAVGVAAFAMVVSVGVHAMALQQTTGRTVLDGVYTEAQAEAGREEYAANCERCHEGVCPDGPPLVGPLFIERWREDNLGSLFRWVKVRMPRNAGGTLTDKVYLDAIAYLLQANGYPSGTADLSASNAGTIQVIGKNGPRPLPGNAVVEVVGCLAKVPTGDWQITSGSAPVRYRFGTDAPADEGQAAAAKPLGTASYILANLEESPAFNPVSGQKVQVRGPLLRQRINVTSIQSVSATCMP